jgi:hypothetical protein
MSKIKMKWIFTVSGLFLLLVISNVPAMYSVAGGQEQEKETESVEEVKGLKPGAKGQDIQVPPPPFTEGIFPCSECHNEDMEPNPERRELEDAHDDIEFTHDPENRWCLDCHDTKNRDKLHLADGRLLDFKESYKLCGQCHGPKLRDWRAGIHGRRTGYWNGQKKYLLCAHCHNPHAPRFKKMKPGPIPIKPESLR